MSKKDKKVKNTNVEEVISPTRLLIHRFKQNKLAVFGLFMFLFMVTVIVATWAYINLSGYNLAALNHADGYHAPSLKYLFGTDKSGRDYFPRVLLGGFISLQVGVIATFVSTFIGLVVGSVAGFYGKWVDSFLMRVTEIISSFPFIPIAVTISVVFAKYPQSQRLYITMFIIGILNWTGLARMVRGQILSLREQEFMLAAKALGIKPSAQIFKHLVPNVIAYVIVNATTAFAGAILTESSLSYLGLSVTEPIPTWGGLLSRANTSIIMKQYWWLWLFPGILLFCLILSVNLIGEGLRDAVDPKAQVKFREQKTSKKGLFKKKDNNEAKKVVA